jgi:arabinogalactan endo-1,4-beta-galactosidase
MSRTRSPLPTVGGAALALALALTLGGPAAAAPDGGDPAGGALVNADFEAGAADAPAGWSERGDTAASFTEAGGRAGVRLTHWSDVAYRVETAQRVTRLAAGHYTLSGWVRAGGEHRTAGLFARDCGVDGQGVDGQGADGFVAAPLTGDGWVRIVLGVRVTRGACTVGVRSDAGPGGWLNADDLALDRTGDRNAGEVAIQGADVSHLTKNVDHGADYRDRAGRRVDPLAVLRANGVNYARLKVWVDPVDGYNSKADTLRKARWARARGMRLLIDFHYSDAWADPGKQNKPAGWADLDFDGLRRALYDHTHDVLAALRAQGTPADLAQIGNEINGGLLWPDGRWDNWDGLAALLTAGAEAVRAASPATKVLLHLAEGGNNGGHRWWFDNAVARGVPFDVIAVSHYVYWHGTLSALQANLLDLTARYGKPVVVVETAYGFTTAENDHEANIFTQALADAGGYPATPAGQARALRDIFTVVAGVPGALGVFYWEPTWTAVDGAGWDPADPASGDGWENQALFDYSGRALPALRVFARY